MGSFIDLLFSAITHGMSHLIGSVSVNKLADLVLWKPENFGSKPSMVLKSGVIAWAQVGPFLYYAVKELADPFCT